MRALDRQHLSVCTDYDLISLRQAVRQQARAAGLAAPQQARFTAAVSEYARLILREGALVTFAVGVATGEHGRRALEVLCTAEPPQADAATLHAVSASPALAGARGLVDEMFLQNTDQSARLAIRMWLPH